METVAGADNVRSWLFDRLKAGIGKAAVASVTPRRSVLLLRSEASSMRSSSTAVMGDAVVLTVGAASIVLSSWRSWPLGLCE